MPILRFFGRGADWCLDRCEAFAEIRSIPDPCPLDRSVGV